jgi:hypothetical protein
MATFLGRVHDARSRLSDVLVDRGGSSPTVEALRRDNHSAEIRANWMSVQRTAEGVEVVEVLIPGEF